MHDALLALLNANVQGGDHSGMFIIIGFCILFGSIFAGYTMHGGKVGALSQFSEFIIIGGAALGSVVIGYGLNAVVKLLKAAIGLLKGNPYKKSTYMDLLQAMYDIFVLSRKEGMVELEKHIENPQESEVLQKYPSFLKNHHAVDLFADTLKLVSMGGVNVYNLADMMEIDLDVQSEENEKVSQIFTSVGDAMPAFGIVAAVLGVVITMQAIGGPPEKIGEKVGAALVGTFLGVLLAYGVFTPLAKATEANAKAEAQYMSVIKHAVVAFARGDVPLVCVEFGRRNIEPDFRPTFAQMEEACKNRTKSEAPATQAEAA